MSNVMRSFSELAESRKAPTIEIVVVPTQFVTPASLEEGMTALQLAAENLRRKKTARAEVEAKLAQAEAVLLRSVRDFTAWMTDIGLRHIADIDGFVAELGEEYLTEEYVGVREQEEQEENTIMDAEKKPFTVGDRRKEVRDMIDRYLNCGDLRVSLFLEATEVAFWLSSKLFDKEELVTKMRQLVKDDVLILDRHGDIEVLRDSYSIHGRFNALKEPLKTEVNAKIKDAIRAQDDRISEEKSQAQMAKAIEVKTKVAQFIKDSDLPILDVLDEAKTGLCGALVSGGGIWFQVNVDNFKILDVAGVPENGFAKLVNIENAYSEHKVRISRKTLKGKDGDLVSTHESPIISVPLEISKNKDDTDRWINAHKFTWHAVRGAIEFAIKCRRKANQGLFHDEFHGGELGKYKPDMEGFIFNIFGANRRVEKEILMADSQLEVERFETKAMDEMIRVTGYNPEFAELLEKQGCLKSEGFFEGKRYDRCPPLIKLVLQRDFRPKSDRVKKTNGLVEKLDGKTV